MKESDFMKIKEVCNSTELSDRAVRFYISKGLVTPEYDENYKGRKSFEFSEEDVKRLSDIAVLRRADFSIEEIKKIIENPSSSYETVLNVSKRKEEETKSKEYVDKLADKLMPGISYNIEQLSALIKDDIKSFEYPKEDGKLKFIDILLWIKDNIFRLIMFICTFSIFTVLFLNYLKYLHLHYRYICVYPAGFVLLLIFTAILLCPIVISLYRLISNRKNIPLPFTGIEIIFKSVITVVVLIVYLMISAITFLLFPFYSHTTDINNYLDLDSQSVADKSIEMRELFPEMVPVRDIANEKYYYKYTEGFDYTFDIIAQWQLSKEEFYNEIDRVKSEFSEFEEIKRGDYNCLFFRDVIMDNQTSVNDSYDFLIFAYNEDTKTVRYIFCSSLENGADQPYFFQLEW